MKELNLKIQDAESVNEQQAKHLKLLGSMRKIPGLILWELNYKTKELKPATFKQQKVVVDVFSENPSDRDKRMYIEVNENCIYFQALNRKNAEKKILKKYGPKTK